jgi:hypothetical protein
MDEDERMIRQKSTLRWLDESVCSLVRVERSSLPMTMVRGGTTPDMLALNLSRGDGMYSYFPQRIPVTEMRDFAKQVVTLAALLRDSISGRRINFAKPAAEGVCDRFEGVNIVKAYVLTFGYPLKSVLALSGDEVSQYYDIAFRAYPRKAEWDTLGKLALVDVDGSLLNSLLALPANHAGTEMEDVR